MSSPLRRLGTTLVVVGAALLVVAAAIALLNVKPQGLASTLTIGGYVGLGLVALGLVSSLVAPSSAQRSEGA